MKALLRKWTVNLRRRRFRRERRAQGDYRAVERPIREKGHRCSNCNVQLHGPFCHICGQKDDDLKRPIWTFVQEIVDNLLQADSKMLRSLIMLLFVPGGLTRSYMHGHRARYSPPLRFYLIASLGFFLILTVANVLILDVNVSPLATPAPPAVSKTSEAASPTSGEPQAAVDKAAEKQAAPVAPQPEAPQPTAEQTDAARKAEQAKAEVKKALADKNIPLSDSTRAAIDKMIDRSTAQPAPGEVPTPGNKKAKPNIIVGTKDSGINLGLFDLPYNVKVNMFVRDNGIEHVGLRQEDIDSILANSENNETSKELVRGMARALKNPQTFNDLFNKWLPRVLFVLIPLFALILRVFHWGKKRYYMNQLVFALHFHTFLFLLLTALIVIVPYYGGAMGAWVFWISASVYLIIALKIGEDQGWIRAFLKAGFIWVTYMTFMVGGLAFVIFQGLKEL
ncbi:DUF3667 domain-containing protein [Kordiimonas marina]|uniref:DUF3667 domain-containing protein n=1 Tax=Kordiimonas marina TaxID=2872312 RepID=UPI001FF1E22A|nr:DUF3667 domain-containing protein [Kordiimonas marina]MCJ9427565.1 DUF3667 domain-containing protein [Kordiimonas marina]